MQLLVVRASIETSKYMSFYNPCEKQCDTNNAWHVWNNCEKSNDREYSLPIHLFLIFNLSLVEESTHSEICRNQKCTSQRLKHKNRYFTHHFLEYLTRTTERHFKWETGDNVSGKSLFNIDNNNNI